MASVPSEQTDLGSWLVGCSVVFKWLHGIPLVACTVNIISTPLLDVYTVSGYL